MALFRATLRTFSRSKGESATAAAAYRAGIDVPDDRLGMVHRFSRRKGVECVKQFAPPRAPAWAGEPVGLWNAVEKAETRLNSRVARELVVSLPHELSADQRLALATEISQILVERYKMAVMLAVHAPDAKGDQRNHHCHILMSTRELTPAGFGKKVRSLDDQKQGPLEVEYLREMVEQRTNAALAAAGVADTVDRRSLKVQAKAAEQAGDYDRAATLTREPTLVVGRNATAAARRGVPQERMTTNAAIRADHEKDLAAYIARAKASGSLMPPSSDRLSTKVRSPMPTTRLSREVKAATRATGKDAKLLNDQAAAAERSREATRRSLQAYVDGLKVDMGSAADILAAYLTLTNRQHEHALWLQRCEWDAELVGLLRGAVKARVDLFKVKHMAQQRRTLAISASVHRQVVQAKESEVVGPAAPAWNLMARRRWKAAHVAHAAKLRKAVLAEQAARINQIPPSEAAKEQASLREELRRAEAAIAARIAASAERLDGALLSPTPRRPASPPSPRLH